MDDVWSKLGWAPLSGDDNIDEVPEELMPKEGCQICKSVWMDILAVWFPPPYRLGTVWVRTAHFWVVKSNPVTDIASAVRLRCFSGHVIDYHATTAEWRHIAPPPLGLTLGLGSAIVGMFLVSR